MIPFILAEAACVVAHLAMAFFALRERAFAPLAYACFCASMCGLTLVGAASEAFRAQFGATVLPAFIAGWCLFLLLELSRFQSGIARPEMLLSTALLLAVGLSLVLPEVLEKGPVLFAAQAASVAIPIAVAIALLGPTPLPEVAPPQMVAVPRQARALGAR
jgi:hypothetical protein